MKEQFQINAYTATLTRSTNKNGMHILDNGNWEIPIYQRAYSWNDIEVLRFMRDLKDGYQDENNNSVPMFIGTMQVSENKGSYREVIDGQQRLTTFLLLLDVINDRAGEEDLRIATDWLTTKVNQGEAQKDLERAIAAEITELEQLAPLNKYAQNRLLIETFLDEENEKTNEDQSLDFIDFRNYITTQVYFICIETKATLSKTLQIFESINATGMDLNGGDLFKVSFYEYLRIKQNADENVFNDISELYAKIERANKDANKHVTNINDVLEIYKNVLISKYNLPNSLYFLGTATFYERLFDKILNDVSSDGFSDKINEVELSINDLNKLIEIRIKWHDTIGVSAEEDLSYYFIRWSRYSRYWISILLYKFAFSENLTAKIQTEFIIKFNKVVWLYSVSYAKAINECHSFIRSVLKQMFIADDPQAIIDLLDKRIDLFKVNSEKNSHLINKISGVIAHNGKHKNLICRLSAMLDEDFLSTDKNKIKRLRNNLFVIPIDIEHIQSYHDSNNELREDVWEEWGVELNSLGNLVVLESDKNRSLGNKPFLIKKVVYKESVYESVRQLINDDELWTLEDAKTRKETKVKSLLDYMFN
ncbi:hypothetical protein SCB49_02434 [unidentified eubacterium SCB49]|nr:hypothetical protein SCB49_02434 [unidentified eubacterium SCB49]